MITITQQTFDEAARLFAAIQSAKEKMALCVTLKDKLAWKGEIKRLTEERRRLLTASY